LEQLQQLGKQNIALLDQRRSVPLRALGSQLGDDDGHTGAAAVPCDQCVEPIAAAAFRRPAASTCGRRCRPGVRTSVIAAVGSLRPGSHPQGRRLRAAEGFGAIRNGLTTEWSSCQVEGQDNRPNTLKRDMYGRVSATPAGAVATRLMRSRREGLRGTSRSIDNRAVRKALLRQTSH
jgi:hypothetical protein